jgi:hypothetical protein
VKRPPLALLLLPCLAPAAACGVCASAGADLDLPPIHAWAFLGGAWFFATALLSQVYHTPLEVFPRLPWALGILGGLFVLSGIALGAGGFLLLIPWAAIPFILSLFMRRPPFDKRTLRIWLQVAGLAALAAILILAFWSRHIRTTRTRAEFIVQWPHTPPARELMMELKKNEPESLDEYRYIFEHGDNLLAPDMVKKLAALGDPDVDIPLLEARLEEFEDDPYDLEQIQDAIEELRQRTRGDQ